MVRILSIRRPSGRFISPRTMLPVWSSPTLIWRNNKVVAASMILSQCTMALLLQPNSAPLWIKLLSYLNMRKESGSPSSFSQMRPSMQVDSQEKSGFVGTVRSGNMHYNIQGVSHLSCHDLLLVLHFLICSLQILQMLKVLQVLQMCSKSTVVWRWRLLLKRSKTTMRIRYAFTLFAHCV